MNEEIIELAKIINDLDYTGISAAETFSDLINSDFFIECPWISVIEQKDWFLAPDQGELKFGRAINPDFEFSPKAVKMKLLE